MCIAAVPFDFIVSFYKICLKQGFRLTYQLNSTMKFLTLQHCQAICLSYYIFLTQKHEIYFRHDKNASAMQNCIFHNKIFGNVRGDLCQSEEVMNNYPRKLHRLGKIIRPVASNPATSYLICSLKRREKEIPVCLFLPCFKYTLN